MKREIRVQLDPRALQQGRGLSKWVAELWETQEGFNESGGYETCRGGPTLSMSGHTKDHAVERLRSHVEECEAAQFLIETSKETIPYV